MRFSISEEHDRQRCFSPSSDVCSLSTGKAVDKGANRESRGRMLSSKKYVPFLVNFLEWIFFMHLRAAECSVQGVEMASCCCC